MSYVKLYKEWFYEYKTTKIISKPYCPRSIQKMPKKRCHKPRIMCYNDNVSDNYHVPCKDW